ncbi:hypothetical protein CPB85DRAFT_1429486 [Mucidula mucida]|nr:hypothetical protein CPB85DRAFT_1429486 [Mucidula mucida]
MDNATPEDVVMDDSDDPQLTIRIPNPKVYMARQSLWVGHRGKLRCDQCRAHNLKCDRQQPTCNQCTWVPERVCKYTPLPTPAHRGVPRCDTCRLKNLKCDRNLPVCDQCEADNNTNCVYSPKRRKKAAGGNPAPHTGGSGTRNDDAESGSDVPAEAPHASSSNSNSVWDSKPKQAANLNTSGAHSLATPYQSPSSVSFTMKHDTGLVGAGPNRPFRRIQTWAHPSFLPLPSVVLHGIASINAAEMPPRVVFETALEDFIKTLMPDISETACMSLEVYTAIVKYLSNRQGARVSTQLKNWLELHHYRSGSTKYMILLVPREAVFTLDRAEEDKYLMQYRIQADRRSIEFTQPPPDDELNWWNAYEFVPVRNQMYDILVYAHRNHGATYDMFQEVRKLFIVSLINC